MTGGIKNRGRTKEDVQERRTGLEEATGAVLEHIAQMSFDPLLAEKNVENMVGCVQVPLGFVGPLLHGRWLTVSGAALTLVALVLWLWPRREMAQVAGAAR